MKKVAIVILNWNGEQMLRRFLPSVLQHSENVADIVVADNASTDASLALLEKEFPTVRTIVLDRNYGFAEGYNRALNQVENEYYVLLNSDVEVTEGWLDTLVSFMDSHPEAAACQPKLLAEHDHTLFEYAGASGGYIDRYGYPFCRGRLFESVEKDEGQYDDVAKCVAKMLVKKFGRKVRSVVFSCVPASSQERNEARNKNFSELVCKFSGAINGFSHVKVVGERTAVHGTKVKKEERAKRLKEKNNIEVDANFFKNKIVCIWDDVVTTGTSFCAYTAQLEQVGAHVTNGIFLGKTSYKYVQQ